MTITFTDNELAVIAEALRAREQRLLTINPTLAHGISCLRQRIEERHSSAEDFTVDQQITTLTGHTGTITKLNHHSSRAYVQFIGDSVWFDFDTLKGK